MLSSPELTARYCKILNSHFVYQLVFLSGQPGCCSVLFSCLFLQNSLVLVRSFVFSSLFEFLDYLTAMTQRVVIGNTEYWRTHSFLRCILPTVDFSDLSRRVHSVNVQFPNSFRLLSVPGEPEDMYFGTVTGETLSLKIPNSICASHFCY